MFSRPAKKNPSKGYVSEFVVVVVLFVFILLGILIFLVLFQTWTKGNSLDEYFRSLVYYVEQIFESGGLGRFMDFILHSLHS